tara:strand:+ start:282 stop:788 length:507 start_codon:yes stop_codon:yes gene_type:complete
MEDIFFHHVLPFINDHTFHINNTSLLKKHKYLKDRQRYINRTHCANSLNFRFWVWETDIDNIYHHHFHIFLANFHSFVKYTIEVLLEDRDMYMLSETIFYERHKIMVPRHVISNTIIEYDDKQRVIAADFVSGQDIVDDVKICSTYRLTLVQKQVLIDNYPYAKALIY